MRYKQSQAQTYMAIPFLVMWHTNKYSNYYVSFKEK